MGSLIKWITQIWRLPISGDILKAYNIQSAKENYTRVIIISTIFMFYEVKIFVGATERPPEAMKLSVCIMVFHMISISIAAWKSYLSQSSNGVFCQVFILIYTTMLVFWSAYLSLQLVTKTGSITMFILTLALTSAFFFRRAIITVIINMSVYFYFRIQIRNPLLIASAAPNYTRDGALAMPQGVLRHTVGFRPELYISDALLMTVICCAIGIVVYRLRLKLFIEQKMLEEIAIRDSMTELFNHNHICGYLHTEVERSKRSGEPVSILMADIDHFKKINDTYGHQMGDEILKKIAHELRESCREVDYVGRYGGEEFLIILTNTDQKQAQRYSERIRRKVESLDFGLPVSITVSGGIKTFMNESSEEMIQLADQALYKAKDSGRNCIVVA